MAEPFSDEELRTTPPAEMFGKSLKLMATVIRLQRERDEARRVAKVLAEAAAENLTPMERQAVEAVEAYPEVK